MSHLFGTPVELGLPAKFGNWRPYQDQAVSDILFSEARITGLGAPTGFGKTLTYAAAALIMGGRVCFLVSTKGLADQLMLDLQALGLIDVRGQSNYACILEEEERKLSKPTAEANFHAKMGWNRVFDLSVADGVCHSGTKCQYKEGGCLYYDAIRRAKGAQLVVTNYAFWLSVHAAHRDSEDPPIGKFDLLVLDEAHNAHEELASFLSIEISDEEVKGLLKADWPNLSMGENQEEWKVWAAVERDLAKVELKSLQDHIKQFGGSVAQKKRTRKLRELVKKLGHLASLSGEWVGEIVEEWQPGIGKHPIGRKWDPIWPAPYVEDFLFLGIKRIVLISATLRPKTLEVLGVTSCDGGWEFIEYPSTFPVANRPVIVVPTCSLTFRSDDADLLVWVRRADQIINGRKDRRGVFHSVSFERSKFFALNTRVEGGRIITHTSRETRMVVDRFKNEEQYKGSCIVSPSLSTGWDFPYEACEYQIIGKVPFPDNRSAVMKARSKRDKDYPMFLAMVELVQAVGRGMRAADDMCETFVIDNNFNWFVNKYRHFAPSYFLDAIRWSQGVPPPPPKLNRHK